MTTTLVTSTLTTGIVLGKGNYRSPLTITNSGAVIDGTIGVNSYYTGAGLTNDGSIQATHIGVYVLNGSMTNNGIVTAGTTGVEIKTGTLDNTGSIYGVTIGVAAVSTGVVNSGVISAQSVGAIEQRGSFYNEASGSINGNVVGLFLYDGMAQNAGGITGLSAGAALYSSGTFDNSGAIAGLGSGFILYGYPVLGNAVLDNSGRVSGFNTGVDAVAGTIINSGLVNGGIDGIYFSASSYALQIINSGTISGSTYAIDAVDSLSLTIASGASFTGDIRDRSGNGLLDMTGNGQLAGLGTTVTGFDTINFDAGARWTLEGSVNGLAGGQSITGFGPGDTLQLDGFNASSYTYVTGTGLVLSNGAVNETLDLQGSFVTSDFAVTGNANGTAITDAAPCFCTGTRIATGRGNMAVENLQIGDLVKTATQGLQPIRWIGRRAYDGRFIAGNHLALPVKIRRHALGFNIPARDLYVSPGHAICEGGVLVHAWRLVNGVSITQATAVERVEYFHIELDEHAVIFAENTPVESFLDNGCRTQFQNAHSAPAAEPQTPCLPLIEDGYYLARLQQRINARAGITPPAGAGPLRGNIDRMGPVLYGWAQDVAAPEIPVEMEVLSGGQVVLRFLANRYRADLRQAGCGSGCHAFEMAMPALPGPFTLRRTADGTVLGADQGWMATRRAG